MTEEQERALENAAEQFIAWREDGVPEHPMLDYFAEIFGSALASLTDSAGEAGPVAWRPIETAPKDGRIVMYWVASARFVEHEETGQPHEIDVSAVDFGCWMNGGEHGEGYHDPFGGIPGDQGGVTHWMPLPPAPGAAPHPVGSALTALQALLDRYVSLVNSGDAGNWNPEEEADVIAARAALAAAPAPASASALDLPSYNKGWDAGIESMKQVADHVAAAPAPAVKGYHPGVSGEAECDVPPFGWRCTRAKGHEGPCAAIEDAEGPASVERGMKRLRDAGYFTPDVTCPVCASVAGQPCTDFMGKVRPEPHAERRKVTAAAPSHPPATPAVAVQAEPGELLRQRANEIASMAKPEYFNKVRAAVLALAAHPKPAAPATAEDAVSEDEIWRVAKETDYRYNTMKFARAILALRSGASAQPAGGAE